MSNTEDRNSGPEMPTATVGSSRTRRDPPDCLPSRPGGPNRSFWKLCVRRMNDHNAMALSAALTYQTIFALIPVLVLTFLVLKTTGAVEDARNSMAKFLDSAGLTQIQMPVGESADHGPASRPGEPMPTTAPARRINVAEKIIGVVERVESQLTFARLGPIGLVVLIWSAVTLLTTVEQSLNRVFEADRSRPLLTRVLLYWSAVTLVPIVLVSIEYLGASGARATDEVSSLRLVTGGLQALAGLAVGIPLLAWVYKAMTNTRVPFRSALVGAAVVVPLWLLVRWGFGMYVGMVVGRKSLYGALGLLPVFLLWINLGWYLFIFGAEIAATRSHRGRLAIANLPASVVVGPLEVLTAMLAVHVLYARGQGPVTARQVAGQAAMTEESVRGRIQRLVRAGLACPVESGGEAWLPARPAGAMCVAEVLAAGDSGESSEPLSASDPQIRTALQRVGATARQAIEPMSLADLLTGS